MYDVQCPDVYNNNRADYRSKFTNHNFEWVFHLELHILSMIHVYIYIINSKWHIPPYHSILECMKMVLFINLWTKMEWNGHKNTYYSSSSMNMITALLQFLYCVSKIVDSSTSDDSFVLFTGELYSICLLPLVKTPENKIKWTIIIDYIQLHNQYSHTNCHRRILSMSIINPINMSHFLPSFQNTYIE